MKLISDDDKGTTILLEGLEFLDISRILGTVAEFYDNLDPTLLNVERDRVQKLDKDYHQILDLMVHGKGNQ